MRSDEIKIKLTEIKLDGLTIQPCQQAVNNTKYCRCTEPSGRFFKDEGNNCCREACLYHLKLYLDSGRKELNEDKEN